MTERGKLIRAEDWETENGRKEVILGQNADGSYSTLPPYIEIDGVQIHPDRIHQYLEFLQTVGKKR